MHLYLKHKQIIQMKKIVLILTAIIALNGLFAQDGKPSGTTRGKSLGLHFFFQDFATGRALDTDKIGDILDRKLWYKPSALTSGFALTYGKGLTPKIDLRGTLAASFEDYLFKKRASFGYNDFLGELDIAAQFKAFDDSHKFIPYLNAGVGASYYKGFVGVIAPVGLGLQYNLGNQVFIDLQTQMRLGLTDNATNHLYHSIGVISSLPAKVKTPKVVKPIEVPFMAKKDTDADGVNDDEDECPTVAGKAALKGCPDGDNDGIADKNDNCPTKAGVAKYQGCPAPDSDGDGINDDNDKCINQAGVARYQGCPVPDTDGDGINDDEDKCKDVPGVAEQQGCPAIKEEVKKTLDYAAKNILFETSSSKIKSSSYKGLIDVVRILNENMDVNINVDGHTDNTGDAEKNMTLSQARADAVKAFLLSKGISESRITATGHGADEPVADNETEAGKAQNRRVELKLGY